MIQKHGQINQIRKQLKRFRPFHASMFRPFHAKFCCTHTFLVPTRGARIEQLTTRAEVWSIWEQHHFHQHGAPRRETADDTNER